MHGSMWAISVVVLCAVCFGIWYRYGPNLAIAFATLWTLLIPQWVAYPVTPAIWLNVSTCVMVFSLSIFLFHPQAKYSVSLRPCDWCMMLMMAIHLISDTMHEGFEISHLVRIYGEWLLPYLAGRLAIQSLSDVRDALPIASVVVLCLGVVGLIECFLKVNVLELVFGIRPFVGPMPDHARFGFNRAHGPFMHSLFFGVVQVMLLPWVTYFTQSSLSSRPEEDSGSGWIVAIPFSVVGIATTLSRGPLLAVGVFMYGLQTLLSNRWRFGLAAGGVAVAACALIFQDSILYQLDKLTNEHKTKVTTRIRGKEVQYTSSQHRKLLFAVYGYPLKNAGLFGYGTETCTGFPPKVPVDEVPDMVKAIDNAYLLYTLRFGYCGLAAFVLLNLAGAYEFGRLSLLTRSSLTKNGGTFWLAAMCAMVVTTMMMFMLVWMPQEIGYLYLFSLGTSAGIGSSYASGQGKKGSSSGERDRSRHQGEKSHNSRGSSSRSSSSGSGEKPERDSSRPS